MFTAKTLSGDLITLEATRETFCHEYLRTLDPDLQPFCEVQLLPEDGEEVRWNVLVNVHDVITEVEQEASSSLNLIAALSRNPHPKALEFLVERKHIQHHTSLFEHPHAIKLLPLRNLFPNKQFTQRFHDRLIARHHPEAFHQLKKAFNGEESIFKNYYDSLWTEFLENPHISPEALDFIYSHEILITSPYRPEYRLYPLPEHFDRYARMPQMLPYFQANPWPLPLELNKNPAAIGFLRANPEWIRVKGLIDNPSEEAMELLVELDPELKQLKREDWIRLAKNPFARNILLKELQKKQHSRIRMLALAENPAMMPEIEQHLSHPGLRITYYARFMKALIKNPAAGRLVLRANREGCYSYTEFLHMCSMPYIFKGN